MTDCVRFCQRFHEPPPGGLVSRYSNRLCITVDCQAGDFSGWLVYFPLGYCRFLRPSYKADTYVKAVSKVLRSLHSLGTESGFAPLRSLLI